MTLAGSMLFRSPEEDLFLIIMDTIMVNKSTCGTLMAKVDTVRDWEG